MTRFEPARDALIVTAMILAAVVGYRTISGKQTQEPLLPVSAQVGQFAESVNESRIANEPADDSRTEQAHPTGGPNDLHQDLVTMSEPVRNHLLWRILGDAGFRCAEVRNSHLLGADAWRADCGPAVAYSIVIDEYNDISINPSPYGDFIP